MRFSLTFAIVSMLFFSCNMYGQEDEIRQAVAGQDAHISQVHVEGLV